MKIISDSSPSSRTLTVFSPNSSSARHHPSMRQEYKMQWINTWCTCAHQGVNGKKKMHLEKRIARCSHVIRQQLSTIDFLFLETRESTTCVSPSNRIDGLINMVFYITVKLPDYSHCPWRIRKEEVY